MRHQHDGVVDLLKLRHLLVGLLVITHTVIDQGHALGFLLWRQLLTQAQRLLIVAVQDLMVHLYHWLDRADAVRCLQRHQFVVDAVVQLPIILIKGKLTQTEQRPPLVVPLWIGATFGSARICLAYFRPAF